MTDFCSKVFLTKTEIKRNDYSLCQIRDVESLEGDFVPRFQGTPERGGVLQQQTAAAGSIALLCFSVFVVAT